MKDMPLLYGMKSSVLKVDPCDICSKQVYCNSIQCKKCQRCVHCHCSDVPGQVSLLYVVLDQFYWTVVKCGNLLLVMRGGCIRWSAIWPGCCVGWDCLIGCQLMLFMIGWVLFWRSACCGMVMSCVETSNSQMCEANGSWNNWEKEGGSINEILWKSLAIIYSDLSIVPYCSTKNLI